MFRKNNKGIAPVIIVIIIGIVLLLFMCCCCGGCSSCVGGNSTSSGTNTESTVSNTASSNKNEENDIQTDTEEVKEPEEVVETVLDPTPNPENETQIAQDSSISQSATEEPKNAEATVDKQETSNTPTVEQPKEEAKEDPKEDPKEEPKKEETKKEEIIIPESFDAVYYAANNPDVVAAVGESPEALYKHYQNYGKKEGRSQNASEEAAKLAKLEEEKQALLQAEAAKQAEEARKAEEAAKQAEQAQNSNSSSNQTVTNNNQSSSSSSSGGYVLNKNTKKFHLPGCSSVNQMKEKNKIYSNQSRDEIISQGYDPCKKCNP